MKHRFTRTCLPLLVLAASPWAHAQSSPWSLRTGIGLVDFNTSSSVAVSGAVVPGGTVQAKDNTTLAMEIGYALNERWTTRFVFGVPPTTTLSASGSLMAMVPPLTGSLGKARYAPGVLSVTYQLGDFAGIRPYAGAGLNYTRVISTSDRDVAGLRVKSAWGTALEAGADIQLDAHWSLFVDLRKVFVKTSATGTLPALGGPAARADVTLNPLITHLGVSYRF